MAYVDKQGGISNGEVINMRVAFKPTATISVSSLSQTHTHTHTHTHTRVFAINTGMLNSGHFHYFSDKPCFGECGVVICKGLYSFPYLSRSYMRPGSIIDEYTCLLNFLQCVWWDS